MRHLQNLVIIFCAVLFIFGDILYAQSVGSSVDIGIRVTSEPPETVRINGSFGINVEVYLEDGSPDVPSGEDVVATVSLYDPNNIQISQLKSNFQWF